MTNQRKEYGRTVEGDGTVLASYTDYDNRTIEIRERFLPLADGAREVVIEQWLEDEFDRVIARHVLDLP